VLLSAGPVVPAPDDGRSCALLIKQPPLSLTASPSLCARGLSPASADPPAASGFLLSGAYLRRYGPRRAQGIIRAG